MKEDLPNLKRNKSCNTRTTTKVVHTSIESNVTFGVRRFHDVSNSHLCRDVGQSFHPSPDVVLLRIEFDILGNRKHPALKSKHPLLKDSSFIAEVRQVVMEGAIMQGQVYFRILFVDELVARMHGEHVDGGSEAVVWQVRSPSAV